MTISRRSRNLVRLIYSAHATNNLYNNPTNVPCNRSIRSLKATTQKPSIHPNTLNANLETTHPESPHQFEHSPPHLTLYLNVGLSFGLTVVCALKSVLGISTVFFPSLSTNSNSNIATKCAIITLFSSFANFIPTHGCRPAPHPTYPIVRFLSSAFSSYRDGSHFSGSGYTSGFRCRSARW